MANLFNEARFKDPEAARQYLETIRWPNGPVCPHCGAMDRMSKLEGKSHRPGLYDCGHCRDQFTVTVGTVFERSKISLDKWLFAATLMAASKKGVSSKQIERMLGVTYKTAWFMTHRLREAMKSPGGILGGGGQTVEADETYVGRKPGRKIKRGVGHKHAVFSLVERGGKARSWHVVSTMAHTIRPLMDQNLAKDSHLMTDEAGQYMVIGPDYASHQTVRHKDEEYVRGNAHTNTIEGFFSIFKRGVIGTFHHISEQHLQRYLNEFDFRYNHRQTRTKVDGKWVLAGFTDAERTAALLKGISNKRLTYRRINGAAQG
jgi:transposase-like protein